MAKISMTKPTGAEGWRAQGCWEWQGFRKEDGYGRIVSKDYYNGRGFVHRIMFELSSGKRLSPETYVMHHCDNPCCCNPAHLFIGTHLDNIKDMVAKGRNAAGERHGLSKLTDDDVREIRAKRDLGMSFVDIARDHGITPPNASSIFHRRTWKHVDSSSVEPLSLPPKRCECGEETYVERTTVHGTWVSYIDFDGSSIDVNTDGLKHSARPATVVCAKCNKRYLNPLANQPPSI